MRATRNYDRPFLCKNPYPLIGNYGIPKIEESRIFLKATKKTHKIKANKANGNSKL